MLMRFIKRFVFVFILLVIAFFVYRLINPTAAKELLYDLKSFSNTTIGTHFSLSGEILVLTGQILDTTGVVVDQTGVLQEFSGDEELLLNDAELPQESFTDTGTISVLTSTVTPTPPVIPSKTISPTVTSTPPVTPKKTTSPIVTPKKTTTSTTSDLDKFLKNFGN